MNAARITENSMARGAQAQYDREDTEALEREQRKEVKRLDFLEAVARFEPKDLWKALPETSAGDDLAVYLQSNEGIELLGKAFKESASHNYMGAGRLLEEIVLACAEKYADMFADSDKRPLARNFGALNMPPASVLMAGLAVRHPVGAVKLEPPRVEVTSANFEAMDSMGGVAA